MNRRACLPLSTLIVSTGLLLWGIRSFTHTDASKPEPSLTAVPIPPAAPIEAAPSSPSATPPAASVADFRAWSERYVAASPAERAAMEAAGVEMARARRPVFQQLIKEDPRAALENAVPMVVRQQLPWSIVNQLETRLNGVAALRVLQATPMPGEPLPTGSLTFREAEFQDGKTYRAYVYGQRATKVEWTAGASLNGVALDADFAVNELPSRTLEIGEVPPTGKPAVTVCPVSGKQALESGEVPEVISVETPAVETAVETVYFCNDGHINPYNQTLIMGEGVSGGAFGFTGILPSAPTPAIGVVKVLIIPMTYADQNAVPSTEAALYSMLRDVGDFYARSSYGRLTLVGVVTPPVKLKHNEAWYVNRDTSNGGDISGTGVEHAESRDEARKLGFDSNDYDCIGVRHNGGPGSYGGLGGGSSVWARSDSASLWAHEIGHCFALAHANFWDTAGTSSIGAGANQEYGNSYDNMGGSPFPAGQYNAQAKSQIRWLPANFVASVSLSGQYRIHAMDQGALDPSRRYAMTVVKDGQRTYWGEVRALFDTNPWVKNGMLLGWRYPNGSGSNIQLIDTTPGSPFLKEDAPISLGSTFSDRESGIHMTTVAFNDSPRSVDVVVNLGSFPANQRPSLSLAASADVVPAGATVTFTATAADADGDALAYSWQNFGDTGVKIVSPNSPVITRTFSTAGTYIVACTVSDMKGGSTTRSQLITVGSGNARSTISGRVTLLGVGLQDVVITANGANGVVTDADGYFTIPNLSANNYTLSPLLYGYTFSELFDNSITVGPSFSGANFEAAAAPVVTIAASVPVANEQSPVTAGRFTISRTGDTGLALVVNVNPALGSATKTTDYIFAPDYVAGSQGFSTFTIPADAAFLDVVVTPVVDTTQEGPETVILQLGPGNGYLVGPQSVATVVINDDDTTLPKVSIAATTPNTTENSAQPGVFTVIRSGATTAALTVNYTVGGSATSGPDFTPLTGSVLIPIGASSAVVNIATVNDSASEQLETVRLTILGNAAYFVDPLATTATVNIADDDLQLVTVAATDASAQEVDLSAPGAIANTGTFVVTRSGDIGNPLTVFYAFAGTPSSGVAALHGVDFEAMPGSVVIPAGQTQASITIVPRFDGFGEGPESVVLVLGAAATNYILGGSSTATVTITDAATDVPYIDVVNISSASEPATNGTFRITVRGGSGTGSLAVNYALSGTAIAGTDFNITGTGNTTTGTTITLNNGATVTKDVVVTPVNDADLEDLESITLTIVPGAAYQTFEPTSAATMWMRDNDQPTVYVDTQVGTGGSATFTEGATTTPVKFYVSRTGSTAAALAVNYTTGGTATSGSDYTALAGSVTIPAGASGVDVPVVITNDTTFEGTETITFDFAPGAYSRGSGAVMYIADNDTATATVSFQSPSSSGSESVTGVNIPVTLSPAQATPVTVDYAVSGTNSSGSTSTLTTHVLPYWVRVVKTGNTVTHFESNDGTVWTQRGSAFTVSGLGGTSYLAGIAVASGSTTATTATIDNLTVTGLSGGGTIGAETSANIGNATGGTNTVAGGMYSFNTPGNGVATGSTADNFRFVHVPVSNSADCTVTARLVSIGTTSASARLGVMLRSTTAQGSVYAGSVVTGATPSSHFTMNRTTLNASSNAPSALTSPVLPQWFRLVRTGDSFATAISKDGLTWTGIGTAQTIAAGPTVLAGLAVSAASDGTIATGIFDNVTIDGSPATGLLGRTVGFVNEQGSESSAGGVWTLDGSGAGITGGSDEAHFAAKEVSGNFTLIARVTSLSGGGPGAQAGVMMRHTRDGYSRQMHSGWVKSGSMEQRFRGQGVTNAFGSGVDFILPPGTVTFAPGETTRNIVLTVVNDNTDEPNNLVTIQLSNANGANISGSTFHGYTIVDDDSAPANPFVGFASPTSSAAESAGTVNLLVSLSAPATASVSVDYAVTGGTATGGGTDYTLANGTLNFAAGESVKAIAIGITDDSDIDANETVIVTLSNPTGLQPGSLSAHTLTITDNDLPVVSIVANDASAAEAGLDPGQFTISRTGPTTAALAVTLARSGTATNGTDYASISAATPFTFTVPLAAASATINVTPLGDTGNEGSETVILTVNSAAAYTVGAPSGATVTIADDDRSTVTLVANDPDASESAGNPGQFTITRTAPTTGSLTVNLAISGTATSTADYATVATTVSFSAGQTSRTVTITPVDDSITEGPEQVTLSIASGSYDIGAQSFDNVTIADNDNPPVLFINSPTAQGPLIANGNGVIVSAIVTDDGAPAPVTIAWSQVSGPGVATIESPAAATTAVTFSAPGTYVLRITATDTQFTVSDQITVVVGSALVAADWFTQDLGPSSQRRGQGLEFGGQFSITGTGAGYSGGTTDQAHVMVRQVNGDGSIVARLTSLPVSTALSGLTIRDSMTRGGRRAVLGFVPGTGLQFRARTTVSTNDTLVATGTGLALPLWLKLDRNATTGDVIASYAADVSGSAGAWTQLGATTPVTMDAAAHFGLTTTNNSTAGSATGVFDNVTLTPAQSGPALLSEDNGATPAAAGSGSLAGSTYTIVGSTSGYYHGWQYYGDMVVTARLATFSSGAGSAIGGIRVAESMEAGAQAHMGRIPQGAYNGYIWTSIAGAGGGGVPSGTSAGNWIRIIRKGNSITAFRAPDSAGSPGTWVQIGQPQTVIMTTPVFVGFFVNNASGVGMNTCTFTGLSIEPLNKAPVVNIASVATYPVSPIALDGTVTDDSFPAPISLSTMWSKVSGPGTVAFGNSTLTDTVATLSQFGAYTLRLSANDGSAQSFRDRTLTGYLGAFEVWQAQNWSSTGGPADPDAAPLANPDFDTTLNLLEYAFGTAPQINGSSPLVFDTATVGPDKFLRLTVPKNPAATDVIYEVQATGDLASPGSWSSAGLVVEANTASTLRVRDNVPVGSGQPRFMRVKITHP